MTAFSARAVYAQDSDPCGGTGGNGEIVSVGNNSFTLKLNEGGQKGSGTLLVTLKDRATIETQSGDVSVSDLNVGDRVTLVGDNNRDGTFTADAVVVCTGEGMNMQRNGQQPNGITVHNGNTDAYQHAHRAVVTVTYLLIGLVWLGLAWLLSVKKRKGLVYLLFFTIFYIYVYKVLDITLIQFQSLLLLQHFVPDLMLHGFQDGTNVNLIPLATLTLEDLKTSFLNILMLVPFGFGLPFITTFRFKKVAIAGLLFSVSIECLQLVTGFMANTTFRVADVNDVIFNTTGVVLGYLLFVLFIRVFRYAFPHAKTLTKPILRYIGTRPQVD